MMVWSKWNHSSYKTLTSFVERLWSSDIGKNRYKIKSVLPRISLKSVSIVWWLSMQQTNIKCTIFHMSVSIVLLCACHPNERASCQRASDFPQPEPAVFTQMVFSIKLVGKCGHFPLLFFAVQIVCMPAQVDICSPIVRRNNQINECVFENGNRAWNVCIGNAHRVFSKEGQRWNETRA